MNYMNDRYLYRAIALKDKDWIYGSLCVADNWIYIVYDSEFYEETRCGKDYLISDRYLEIDPNTIGQCTGISAEKSYRGNTPIDLLVFEGDILKSEKKSVVVKVVWDSGLYTLESETYIYSRLHNEKSPLLSTLKPEWEIIGNTHDNPLMLLGSAK